MIRLGCPRGVPAVVQARTNRRRRTSSRKSRLRPSFGVQGALVARLLDPLPFRLPLPAARLLAGQGRSLALAKPEGQGLSPLHPSCCGTTDAARRGSCPPLDTFLLAVPSTAFHSGWRLQSMFWCIRSDAFIRFPLFYESMDRTRSLQDVRLVEVEAPLPRLAFVAECLRRPQSSDRGLRSRRCRRASLPSGTHGQRQALEAIRHGSRNGVLGAYDLAHGVGSFRETDNSGHEVRSSMSSGPLPLMTALLFPFLASVPNFRATRNPYTTE